MIGTAADTGLDFELGSVVGESCLSQEGSADDGNSVSIGMPR